MFGSMSQTRASNFAPGGASRSDILGRKYQPFSNPFFDQASTYIPPSIKSLFGFCRYFFLTHGVIHAVSQKAAEYPITDVIFQHQHEHVVSRWEELMLGILNYRVFQFETNLDYYVYGNSFASPSFPFKKYLKCGSCNAKLGALETRKNWRYTNSQFWLSCPKCGQSGYAKSYDESLTRYSDIAQVRWNPENVSIIHNETTGRVDYILDMSQEFKSQIYMGRKDLVATTPEIFLEAVKQKRAIVFDPQAVFHMRRPSLSAMNKGWGIPLLMPVLKDAYYMQVMKKAQESVLLTHLVPQIFLFPQPATAGADPFTVTNLQNWRDHIRREIARQRMDPSYYGILPFPLGHQTIGENGRSLLLMPEIQQLAELMVIAMGFPTDLIFGQGTYAGSSVNMRMLENFFLSNVQAQLRQLHWFMKRIGSFMNWPIPQAKFKPFRMADDLQRQAFMFQMNQAGKITDTTLLAGSDIKVQDEAKLRLSELALLKESVTKHQLLQAEVQGEVGLIQAKYQTKAQAAMQQAQQAPAQDPFASLQSSSLSGPPQVTLDATAAALAKYLKTAPEDVRQSYLSQIQVASPEMGQLVQQNMQGPEGAPQPPVDLSSMTGDAAGQGGAAAPAVDMRPMPNVLPPRRQ